MLIGLVYIIISCVGFYYFLLNNRKFDFLSVGFVSQQIYFSPCVVYYFTNNSLIYPVENGVYICGFLIILSMLIFSFRLHSVKPRNKLKIDFAFEYHAFFSTILALIAFFISFYESGNVLFSGAKSEVLESISRFYIIWSISAIYGLITSFILKNKIYFVINSILILMTVFIGFRSIAAIAVISLLVIYFSSKRESVNILVSHYKSVIFGLFFGCFFLIYKGLYIAIKFGNYDVVSQKLLDKQFYIDVLSNAEPFGIQMIFSDVLKYDYFIGLENLNRIILMITVFSNDLGIDARSFNDYFQNDLYGNVGYGMGSNVWAHMYSSGGWLLLLMFIILYAISLRWLSYKIYYSNLEYVPFFVLLGSYWAFYIHRNDLFYQLGLEKRVLIIFLIVSLSSIFYKKFKSTYRKR